MNKLTEQDKQHYLPTTTKQNGRTRRPGREIQSRCQPQPQQLFAFAKFSATTSQFTTFQNAFM